MMHANVHHNANNWQLEEIEKKQTRFDIFYLPSKKNEHHAFFSKTSIGYPWYRQERHRLLAIKSTDIGRPMLNFGRALENLFFPDEIKELIFSIEQWKKNETWYKSKGIPWKRGWLLYGKPGTGKTALARAFAEDLNMPIYVFSLSQMNNSDLMTAWKNMQLNVPCIALIEDIDNVFHGRKNIIASNQMFNTLMSNKDDEEHSSGGMYLSFDCLLNCLDGVDKSNGVFTIITTNDISKVDEAIGQPIAGSNGESQFISTRPGRIDRAIELGFMNKSNKYAMAQRILADNLCALSEAKSHIEKNINETPAQFQEYCSNIALNHFWVKNHPN
jgi:SpoVK/Ycf46/Vps4 family AAA+-type ATPase